MMFTGGTRKRSTAVRGSQKRNGSHHPRTRNYNSEVNFELHFCVFTLSNMSYKRGLCRVVNLFNYTG